MNARLALMADAVVAFSPQIVIDPEQRKAAGNMADADLGGRGEEGQTV